MLTGAQARELVELAREQGVFFMEAVWTRYQPVVKAAQEVVFGGTLGEIKRVDSRCVSPSSFTSLLLGRKCGLTGWRCDLRGVRFDKDFGDLPVEHRMLNPALAGGALFDLGPVRLSRSTTLEGRR